MVFSQLCGGIVHQALVRKSDQEPSLTNSVPKYNLRTTIHFLKLRIEILDDIVIDYK